MSTSRSRYSESGKGTALRSTSLVLDKRLEVWALSEGSEEESEPISGGIKGAALRKLLSLLLLVASDSPLASQRDGHIATHGL